ncbi:MAG: efflux RND transporter periplasmic adaptor subunit [Planctomycetota bacterium]
MTKPAATPTVWTCSMHPQIRLSKPGKCPICAMDLIPAVTPETATTTERLFTTSETAKALMDIETTLVERKLVEAEIRMVGKIDYDETKLSYITAWVPGRLDRLFVDYTGVPVRKGDHMVELYSPELLSAQEELIQALGALEALSESDIGIVRETTEATVTAAREKLRLWGLTPQQIAEIEERGKGADRITVYAPTGGIVVHKHAQQGMYVDTGTRIYTIADLSQVWVKLDAYESDLMWLRYGQKVVFTTVSHPGETFTGTISFIDPVLDAKTRTVKVRLNASNIGGKLKPGMFVKAVGRAQVAAGGKVMAPELTGKWISPMHPEIIKDAPGKCDVCGMDLVTAESLGYTSTDPAQAEKPLVIPASAPLITGTRAIVYVQVPDAEKPTFEGREISLGPRAGDYYLVRSGLEAGERVVTRGNFKIDSALQLQPAPSMMSPEGATQHSHTHQHGAHRDE